MRCRHLLVPVLAAWLVAAANAQVTVLRPYAEKENPNTPVRGHAVVGVSLPPGPGDQEQDRLFVFTPSRQGQVLSVDVTTASGRVQGDALVKLDGTAAGAWTELSVPKRFRRDDPEGLAVGVQGQEDSSGRFYVASWGRRPEGRLDDQPVWLYVNRGRAPTARVYGLDPKGRDCEPAKSPATLRFNTICKLPAGDIPPDGRLTLVRRDGGSAEPQAVVLVR